MINTYLASGFLREFLNSFSRYFEENKIFTGDPATRWLQGRKIDFLNKKLQCHHMMPRWKKETFAIILVYHRKMNFFRRVTAISVYVVGEVTLLTDARSGALMGASIFFQNFRYAL